MAEQDSADGELRALRRAADERDWNGCRDAIGKLLSRLPAPAALELVRRELERRLPLFERHQPGVSWPRDLIESLRVVNSSDGMGLPWPTEDDDDFPGPGANSFSNGLYELWQALGFAADAPRRIEALVDAVSGAVMAEMVEAWGTRHPAQWARRYELGLSAEYEPELYALQLAMVRDPETARIERAAWLDVADRLAEALRLPAP